MDYVAGYFKKQTTENIEVRLMSEENVAVEEKPEDKIAAPQDSRPSKLKKYFDIDLRMTILYSIVGAIAGYISFQINNAGYAVLAMLIILAVMYVITKKLFKIKEDKKWWLSNGIIVYLLLWFVVWTILFNIVIR